MMTSRIILVGLLISGFLYGSEGARILLLPVNHHPHVNFFAVIGKSLLDAGHDVTILTTEGFQDFVEKSGVPYILQHSKKYKSIVTSKLEILAFGGFIKKIEYVKEGVGAAMGQCQELLESEELLMKLDAMKFDMALVDGNEAAKLLYIVPYRLEIPYITLAARVHPWILRIPALPSVEGFSGLFYMPQQSSIFARITNTALYVAAEVITSWINDDGLIKQYAPNKPLTTFLALARKSEMTFIILDTLCLDTPRVSAPHFQYVAGLGTRPAEPLPEDLEQFVSGADHGIIVVSFGSAVKAIPQEFSERLLTGFGQLAQRVIMRCANSSAKVVPKNVQLIDWLPQNDLLGHAKTRLFITHGGNNGQQEAVYHGVPMLCIPLILDQNVNAIRAVERGYGLQLDWRFLTSEQLIDSVNEIISNPIYSKNIKKCSCIIKQFPKPQDTITFWVEHVLKFGSSHLRPAYIDMPLWKFFMLDIVLVISISTMCLTGVVCMGCRSVCLRRLKVPVKQKRE